MKKNNHLTTLFLFLLMLTCESNEDIRSVKYYNVPDVSKTDKKEQLHNITLDTINIESNIETSYTGNFWINNDNIYFTDTYFMYVLKFDKNGKFIEKYIGEGEGPNEVNDIDDVSYNSSNNTYNLFSPKTSSIYMFNKDWEKVNEFVIDWDITRSYKDIVDNPSPLLMDSYEFANQYKNILKPWNETHLAISIESSHPKFNGHYGSELYYNNSRILALINLETGKIDNLIGRRSPFYLSNQSLPIFDHFNYETFKDIVYVDFWVDKEIYILDKKTGKATGKFGVPGRDMNVNYQTTSTYQEADKLHFEHRKKFGRYRDLKYLPEKDLLFRFYYKGSNATSDGMQIYKNNSLIGDIDVPIGFKIIGILDNNLYGTIKIEDQEDFNLYRVKLNYE